MSVKHIDARAPVEDRVELIITGEQASALLSLLAIVGGDPNTTRRGLLMPICKAFQKHGFTWETFDLKCHSPTRADNTGHVEFLRRS